MKRFYFLAVFLWSIYFAVFPVLLDAAISKSKAQSNAQYEAYFNDGSKLAQTILTQVSGSIGENVFIDSIGRIASEMQNMGGLKSLQSEAFKQVFIDEVTNLTNEIASSLDEETLQAISSSSIYKMLSDLINNPKLQDSFKSVSSKNTSGIGIGKDAYQISAEVPTYPAAGGGSVTYNTNSNGGLLIADIITGLASFFGSVIASLGTGAFADIGLLIEDAITDIAGDLGSIAAGGGLAEAADYLEAFIPDIFDIVHGIPTVIGALAFGAGSGFLFGTLSAVVGRALTSPIIFLIFPSIEVILSLLDGALMALVGLLAGLFVGVLGFGITHIAELFYDLIPGIEYNSTYWTVGGAGIVAAVATILGGLAGAGLGFVSMLPVPIPIIGNPGLTIVISALLGATSGMIMGFGIGLIALSGA